MTQSISKKKLSVGMNDVIEFYKKDLGSYNMVFKYLKFRWLFFLMTGMLSIPVGITALVLVVFSVSCMVSSCFFGAIHIFYWRFF